MELGQGRGRKANIIIDSRIIDYLMLCLKPILSLPLEIATKLAEVLNKPSADTA